MSTEDQFRWDTQHQSLTSVEPPAGFLRDCLEGCDGPKAPGKALDIACGKGQNALYLAERDFAVTALDISSIALDQGRRRAQERNLEVDWRQCDLETVALPQSEYDLVIKINYLQRSLIEPMKGALKLNGYVICETFLIDQAAIGHPKKSDYLLKHNELLDFFRGFRVLRYREGKITDSGAACFRAGIFAQRIAV